MNLQKLFEMQKELDERIIQEHGLEGQDLLQNKILALLVKLGECASEWRGFEFWSKNQEPRKEVFVPMEHPFRGMYIKNQLLEEYVDAVHFFLSIAIQKGWQDALYLHEEAVLDLEREGFQGGLTGALLEVNYHLLKSYMEKGRDEKIEKVFGYTKQEFHFRNAWFVFVAIGLIGFKFTPEQIEDAYFQVKVRLT